MTTTRDDPSLLRFLQDRLSQDVDLIMADTPRFDGAVNNPEFERRFQDRSGLLHRIQTDRTIVALTVEFMQAEQGSPAVGASSFEGGPATSLGSGVLKLLAGRYADHPDYLAEWAADVALVGL